MTAHLSQDKAVKVLSDLRKLAEIGVRQPAESKYNEYRARWLRDVIKINKSVSWDSADYFSKELANMPQHILAKIEGAKA